MDPEEVALARRLSLSTDSPTTLELIKNRSMTVSAFIAAYRRGVIWREFPQEQLGKTVQEALESGDPKVRKLLLDTRWRKR